jgi:sugar (pentulose or hexulose) kinase
MYRAVLEGIALSLKSNVDWMLSDIHKDIKEIRIGGGGSNSTVGMQIFADVFGVPIVRTTTTESCALGAAIDAAVGCGMYPSFDEAVAGMVHIRDRFEPYPENHRFYTELLDRVYSKVRPATDPVYMESQAFWDEWGEKKP